MEAYCTPLCVPAAKQSTDQDGRESEMGAVAHLSAPAPLLNPPNDMQQLWVWRVLCGAVLAGLGSPRPGGIARDPRHPIRGWPTPTKKRGRMEGFMVQDWRKYLTQEILVCKQEES